MTAQKDYDQGYEDGRRAERALAAIIIEGLEASLALHKAISEDRLLMLNAHRRRIVGPDELPF